MIDPDLITTVRVDQLPPDEIALTDVFPFETLDDEYLKKATFQQLVDFVNIHSNALQYEIKDLWVDASYVSTNFDTTGLGRNLCLGWAICNSENGTPDLDGLVTIGYGSTYSSLKGVGGSKDAVVVAHTHGIYTNESDTGNNDNNIQGGTLESPSLIQTESTGVSGTDKNMQPYMIMLKIMKL